MEPIYVVGAGGIGCAVGYALCAAGLRPVFVEADPAKVRWGRSHGVMVDRRPPLAATFQPFTEWDPQPGSIVILCTKCYDNARILPRLPPRTTLIPIQNGFDRALQSQAEDVEGIASFISECYPARTHTRITRRGCLHLGSRHPFPPAGEQKARPMPARTATIVEALRRHGPFRVHLVPNILPYKYTKLLYNAAISPSAAAAGLDNGQLLSVAKARRLFFGLLRENYGILHGAGIPLARIGLFHPATVQRILRRITVAGVLACAFYPTLRGTYCSMAGDLPRGRTEIDFYNRHLIDLAGDRPCPLNRRVVEVVTRMEREGIPPRVDVLDELAA
jgi:2-dehydropantoate 2-reductase